MKVKVFAKLNLSLNVGKRQGEYHLLDSVVCSADIFDVVDVRLRDDREIAVRGTADVALAENTAYRAASAFMQTFDVCGCDIKIEKHIPKGAGLGGSSADAAAVVYCLCALHGVDVCCREVKEICARVGSDVNFMFVGGIARMTGKGDDLQFLPFEKVYFAVTTFPVEMSTKTVFAKYDEFCAKNACDNDKMAQCIANGETECALSMCSNGLQTAVAALNSYAENYLQFCRQQGFRCTMTGSGSAFFVPCKTAEEAISVCKTLNENGYSTTVCQTLPYGIEKFESTFNA